MDIEDNNNYIDEETDDEEENQEDELNKFLLSPNKTTREKYILKKEPIQNYCEGSFEKLKLHYLIMLSQLLTNLEYILRQ